MLLRPTTPDPIRVGHLQRVTAPQTCLFNKEISMKKNVGGIDRVLRIVVGLVLVALAATGQIGLWGWLGLIVLGTGLMSHCAAYSLFGFNTCTVKSEDPPQA